MAEKGKEIITTILAALAGIWVGCQIRQRVTGGPAQALMFEYIDEEKGLRYRNVPVSSKLFPALGVALVGQPRWLFGLVGGLLTGSLIDDQVEVMWVRWLVQHSSGVSDGKSGNPV